MALGDFICFSPTFITALENGFLVDVICTSKGFANLDYVVFEKEKNFDAIRFLSDFDKSATYETVFLLDKKGIIPSINLLLKSKLKSLIPQSIQKNRSFERLVFNFTIRPLFGVFGSVCSPIFSNDSVPVWKFLFDSFCKKFSISADFNLVVESLKSKLNSQLVSSSKITIPKEKFLVVHLFRDLDFKLLNSSSYLEIARFLKDNYSQYEILLLCNLSNSAETKQLSRFEDNLRSLGLKFRILPKLTFFDIIKIANSTPIYLGLDHGISHLFALFCKRSVLLYGSTKKRPHIDLLWPPLITGEQIEVSPEIRSLKNSNSSCVIIHASSDDYLLSFDAPNYLLNKTITQINLKTAFDEVSK